MMTENTTTIAGNLTADPEVAYTTSGVQYARFTIAHTPRRFDRDTGSWVDGEALFLRAVAWRDLAEHLAESLHKGQRVIACGQLRQSTWVTDTGEKRSVIELHVTEIGPSLRFHTAEVAKAARTSTPEPADPWVTTPTPTEQPQPATAAAGNGSSSGSVPGFTDEPVKPPF
ncbi:MAG: single-stranded DNA-binding protein [Streptosporangiales bacterium]|nr:single-stranded DNA-binding protein [Streptosporangiales bacterium]